MSNRDKEIGGKSFEETLGANPFACGDFKIYVRKILDYEKLKLDEGVYVPSENIMEQEKFVKLYLGDKRVKAQLGIGIENVNEYGLEMLFWIMFRLTAGQDYFFLDKEAYMRDKGISSVNTFKKCRKELVTKGVIAPIETAKNYYWINPKFFFCGSRVNKYRDKVVEYEPKKNG